MIFKQCQTEPDPCRCQAAECFKLFNTSAEAAESCYTDNCFISKRALDDQTLQTVTAVYIAILFVGVVGNVGICLVIRRHPLLKTHSSAYLLNLAMSDLVTLCVGPPFEIIMNWNQYPWPFPDSFCNIKALLAETTNSVSALTVLLFSIERYIAICHPFLFVKLRPVRQNVCYLLVATWVLSIMCAVPYATHHRADYLIKHWPYTTDGPPVKSTKMCMLNIQHMAENEDLENEYFELKVLFHFSALIFFVIPLLCILTMYLLIACKLMRRKREIVYSRADSTTCEEGHFRLTFILTSLIISFFVCYTPFQFQRLSFFHMDELALQKLNQYLYFISGFLYYLATIVNPILYNLVSTRFRKASKEVLLSLLPCTKNPFDKYYPPLKIAFTTSVRLSETQKLRSGSVPI